VGLSNGVFTRDQFVDDAGNSGQDVGANQFRFAGLAAGASTTINATFTASQAGNQKIDMQWWGSSATSGICSDIPDTTVDLSCAIPVNP
jgi:hypothetical protein